MSTFNYQIDYGDGYENTYPDGYGLHDKNCNDPECSGCWNDDDYDAWFKYIEKYDGNIKRARVLFGGQVYEEKVFIEDEEEEENEEE